MTSFFTIVIIFIAAVLLLKVILPTVIKILILLILTTSALVVFFPDTAENVYQHAFGQENETSSQVTDLFRLSRLYSDLQQAQQQRAEFQQGYNEAFERMQEEVLVHKRVGSIYYEAQRRRLYYQQMLENADEKIAEIKSEIEDLEGSLPEAYGRMQKIKRFFLPSS